MSWVRRGVVAAHGAPSGRLVSQWRHSSRQAPKPAAMVAVTSNGPATGTAHTIGGPSVVVHGVPVAPTPAILKQPVNAFHRA